MVTDFYELFVRAAFEELRYNRDCDFFWVLEPCGPRQVAFFLPGLPPPTLGMEDARVEPEFVLDRCDKLLFVVISLH